MSFNKPQGQRLKGAHENKSKYMKTTKKAMNAVTNRTKTVTIISLWTRRTDGPDALHRYDISVSEQAIGEMLREAYERTNVDGRPMSRVCSTTSGDLLVVDGVHYLVAAKGFHLLTCEQAAEEIVIADTFQWDAWNIRTIFSNKQPGVPLA